jgi:spore coat polysaccharide biosynthesis protein SpsF
MILAILQARMSSTRLPGKVLKPILGEPMISRQLERLNRARGFDSLLVATSTDRTDDAIELLCAENGIDCFRGSLKDVLDRFYQAAKAFKADNVVRLTGDCPLIDPQIVDKVIDFHLAGRFDYTSNKIDETFPDGLDVEVFGFNCLEQAWNEAALPSEREHVTPFIYKHPGRYRLGSYRNAVDLSSLRLTVDDEPDFDLVTRIYGALYPGNPEFTTRDILDLLDREPGLISLNSGILRKAGYLRSLWEDAAFLRTRGG